MPPLFFFFTSQTHQPPILHAHTQARSHTQHHSQALALHGVVRVLTPADIPGANAVGGSFLPIDCEPLFAETVSYHGQPVALVLATSQVGAERGARLVGVRYRPTEAPVLDIDDAKAQGLIHSLCTWWLG